MAKTIQIHLNKKSIQKAITELEAYQIETNMKLREFVYELDKIGLDSIHATMSTINEDETGDYTAFIDEEYNGSDVKAKVHLTGNKVLFLEFSAGIRYGQSGSAYPTDAGSEYGMGTYPSDKGHWNDPKGWYYTDDYGNSRHTYGNPAYMPVYNAGQDMKRDLERIARQVFSAP